MFYFKNKYFKFNINFVQLTNGNYFHKNVVSAKTFPTHN